MRFVYYGSSQFSEIVLRGIINYGVVPELVVTTPDKPQGRGLKIKPTPVKQFASCNNIRVLTPFSLKEESFIKKIKSLDVDLFIIVSYGNFIPSSLLILPRIMPIAVHPSLLPCYRGAAPINWAIIRGEQTTGVSIFKVSEKIDAGPLIIQRPLDIKDSDDALTLSYRLANLSIELLLRAVLSIEKNDYRLILQDESKVSFAPKLRKEDGRIKWERDAISIRNLVRGLRPWPEAFTFYKDTLVKILDVEVIHDYSSFEPGTIIKIEKSALFVTTGEGIIKIKRIKPQGKREMEVRDFLCGHQIKEGEKFS